ncbi:ABC transporter ATP-binding protein [Rugosimonospora acidiphila]
MAIPLVDRVQEEKVMSGVPVRVESVSKTFGSGSAAITAVDDVSIELGGGTVTALTGPSGSGKSTLLHVIGAIESADSGAIVVGDTTITSAGRRELAAYRRHVGFVFQRFHLLPALTARDNVIAPLIPDRRRARGAADRAMELLASVGLAGRENALPSQLSGGQQQRVAIARALIGEPGILIADEPTGNLDSANGTAIVDLLLALNAEHGTTLVIATHDAALASRCGRTVTLADGRILSDTGSATGTEMAVADAL